ncbi:hypothetical protein Desaci_3930 [Desulfosporosinus acidiphilus SJ4]|uniref:Copper-sensing transcriptional repressor CsoR n=1 Tax=Desulfosporosinus acidiphilus (strain DSM 22704 / JCM 16185 / SJ4) TaxID=646529 RepID=I4DAI0_DESAJ|nr:hypothetical protein Desaci_3930 [Desulfosporosinus acidiphilus SJ4]
MRQSNKTIIIIVCILTVFVLIGCNTQQPNASAPSQTPAPATTGTTAGTTAGTPSCAVCQHQGGNPENRTSPHDDKTIKALVTRMNKIEGQIRGIKGMIERHAYCDDVLNQISSAQSALDGVSRLLLEKHMKSCIKEQLETGDEQVIDEVLQTIFRMIR